MASTAAAAMVVLDADLEFVAAGYILVPSRVTTAPMAEAHFVALLSSTWLRLPW